MPSNEQIKHYQIVDNGDNEPAEILIFDVIGDSWWEETVTAKSFVKDLQALGPTRPLNVRINSPGGSVFDGTAIYNALKKHKGNVEVNIEGIALSMASVIAMVGDTVNMADNALMMVHNPQSVAWGESKDLRAQADLMDKAKGNLVKAYTAKSGLADDVVSALMDATTWMTADEALAHGLIDNVTGAAESVVAFDSSVLKASGVRVPKHLQAKLAAFSNPIPKESKPMADAKPERIAATVQQLKALDGADDAFVVEQLSAGATEQEAIVALNKRLKIKLEAQQNRSAELETEVKKLTDAAAATPVPVKPVSESGVKPVASAKLGDGEGGGASSTPWGSDPHAFYKAEVSKAMANGMDATRASRLVNKNNPGLVDAMAPAAA